MIETKHPRHLFLMFLRNFFCRIHGDDDGINADGDTEKQK